MHQYGCCLQKVNFLIFKAAVKVVVVVVVVRVFRQKSTFKDLTEGQNWHLSKTH